MTNLLTTCPRCLYDRANCICADCVPVGTPDLITFNGLGGLKIELSLLPIFNEVRLTANKGVEPFLRSEFDSAVYNHSTNELLVKAFDATNGFTAEYKFIACYLVQDYNYACFQRAHGDNYNDETDSSVFV